ncbi:glycosyltransferase family 4 protein [Actibacterium sp.]|uniref:glycosyltransferase family 4 protein n=1 Tax=Actibacterium sp. TaxID=1872125 RepID=UPI0035625559
MRGAGTKPAITPADPPARLLDVSRLVSRAGRGAFTGIDRVEMAYLTWLSAQPAPFFALARTALGFVLLDRDGALGLAARLRGDVPWGAPDLLGRLIHRSTRSRAVAEADLRRLALARCRPKGLARLLARHLPTGAAYINVGHSNLGRESLAAIRAHPGARIAVMIHDTIPLDFPQFTRPGLPERFAGMLLNVGASADLILCNSAATAADVEARLGDELPIVVAHLGVETPTPDATGLPPGLPLSHPYFVTTGTIEGRKNHDFLLTLWETMLTERPASHVPALFMIGSRGWRNEEFFARFDGSPLKNRVIFELPGLDDGAMAALTAGACGLLFPSLAEGYGLPPLEAMALGTPVLANDLPVFQEVLGDFAVYAPVTDAYSWRKNIDELMRRAGTHEQGKAQARAVPTWQDHFSTVLNLT